MTRRILILYGTTYGQTALIARRIANQLSALGYAVTLVNGDDPDPPNPDSFDGVVIGASLIRGHHQKCVERYVRRHLKVLNSRPSAFFSVSSSAAAGTAAAPNSTGTGQQDALRELQRFLTDTGWSPGLHATIAGAIMYRKYGPFTRWMLRRICEREGGPTDTSRDHELTDWQQVEYFVDEFTELPGLRNGRPAPVSHAASPSATPCMAASAPSRAV